MEAEEHTRLRRLVSPTFAPKAADRYRPFMREVASSLLEPLLPNGHLEAVDDICEPYPIPLICELLGAPKEDWKIFSNWADIVFRRQSDPSKEMTRSSRLSPSCAPMTDPIAERRARPRTT
jgi:cytochrome P450